MDITIANTIRVKNPTNEILDWAKENLILPNPEYAKKVKMGFWVGKTPKELYLYEIFGDTLVLPYGLQKQVFDFADWGVDSSFPGYEKIDYGEPVPLYDYQQGAVNAMYDAGYGILQSPAGSGKTQIGIALIKKWQRPALWLCHTADLLTQSKERAEKYIDKSLIGTITEGKVNIGKGVTFATIQTMCKLDLYKYHALWDVVIVDEAHRVSGTPTQLTRYYKTLNTLSARHKYGLTATPDRSDGLIKATYALLGEVKHIVPAEAVEGKIMKVGIRPIQTGTGLSEECVNPDGTLCYAGLISHLCEDEKRTGLIVTCLIAERAHSCLVLSDRLGHLTAIMNSLPDDMREKAVMIDGLMNTKKAKAEREKALEQMRTGEKRYLFATYSLAKEGLDIPRLDRLCLATPVKYNTTVVQSIGRIARVFPGKTAPIAYDFVDSCIGYCAKAYKERCKHYRQQGAYFV